MFRISRFGRAATPQASSRQWVRGRQNAKSPGKSERGRFPWTPKTPFPTSTIFLWIHSELSRLRRTEQTSSLAVCQLIWKKTIFQTPTTTKTWNQFLKLKKTKCFRARSRTEAKDDNPVRFESPRRRKPSAWKTRIWLPGIDSPTKRNNKRPSIIHHIRRKRRLRWRWLFP